VAGGELGRGKAMKKIGLNREQYWRQNEEEKEKTRDEIFGCCNEGSCRLL